MTIEELKVFVQQYIKTNYNEEITGAVLQNVILNTIDTLRAFDYSDLSNKPSINGVTLVGDKSAAQLGLVAAAALAQYYTKSEIDALLDEYYDMSEIDDLLGEKEDLENKVQSLSNSTVYYPSVKCVKDVTDALNTRINNISGVGRFLSTWNCTTGLPATNPTTSPYLYITGDYYIVGTVGTTNYIPNGDRYIINQASTVAAVEPNIPNAGDIYKYDGTNWTLLRVQNSKAVWGSIEGTMSNQTDLSNALSDITTDITALENGKISKIQNPNNGKFASINSDGTVGNSNYDSSSFATAAQGALASTAYQKPQGGIPESDLNNSVTEQLWFFVSYVSPDYDEAIAAYDLGKKLYTIIDGQLYFCTSYNSENESLIFTSIQANDLSQGVLGGAILYNDNTWDTDYVYFDTTEVKTQTISVGSTTTEYPSAKAVYDYGQALINNIDNRLIKVATYDTTTYQQIFEWYTNNCVVICSYNSMMLYLGVVSEGDIFFYNDTIYGQYYVKVTSTDVWSAGVTSFEKIGNKVTSISSSSTNTQYPSAKCVYDNLQNLDKIFVVDVGETSFAEIKAAYDAGKMCIAFYDWNGDGNIVSSYYIGAVRNTEIVLCRVDGADRIYHINVSNENVWTKGFNTLITTGARVTSISSSSNDFQLPSAKCVYDNLQSVINKFQENAYNVTVPANATTQFTVNFGTEFSNTPSVTLTLQKSANPFNYDVRLNSVSTTGFTYSIKSTNSSEDGVRVNWQAINK